MTERNSGRHPVTSALDSKKTMLAGLSSPPLPAGAGTAVGNRVFVYARPEKASAVLPHIDRARGGLVLAGPDPRRALGPALDMSESLVLLNDPAAYEKSTATIAAPFALPDTGLVPVTLNDVLDRQIRAGAAAALSPTGYIPAGRTDILREAARQFSRLGRVDAIFTAPVDVSLLGPSYYPTTAAILAALGSPVALVLGGQGDPLTHSKHIIPNLRDLAAQVPLMALRTDFNGLDLVGHGAIAAAIGTGGSLRHTVDPSEVCKAFSRDQSPSVLWPDLVTWFKGTKINELYGARPSLAPLCYCGACGRQRLTRFLRREHQDEAIGHAVATWSPWAADLLGQPTIRDRAQYWQNRCKSAVDCHAVILAHLQMLEGLEPQESLKRWAQLPAWSAQAPAPVL
jgi:hypothetical protein